MEAMEEAPVAQEQQENMELAAAEGEAGGPIPLSALQVGCGGVLSTRPRRRRPPFFSRRGGRARCRPLQKTPSVIFVFLLGGGRVDSTERATTPPSRRKPLLLTGG